MRFFYILIFAVIANHSYGQSVFGTCPLDSGNVWVYDYLLGDYKFWNLVDSTVISNDSLEYNILHGNFLGQLSNVEVRLREDNYYVQRMPDSFNTPHHERIYYKKGAKVGDSWMQPDVGGITDSLITEVTDTARVYIFNNWVTIRILHTYYQAIEYWETWTDEFGLMSVEDDFGIAYYLYCCIIDGIAYGDTTVLGTHDILNSPHDFVLDQNYPNPFNPATKIKYSVPKTSEIQIKVYDILGNEIKTLVNEEKPAGTYEINWNAADMPSGIYFYQITAGEFIQTKKMVLLK